MRKKAILMSVLMASCLATHAEDDYEEGFLTSYLNHYLERAMQNDSVNSPNDENPKYGRHLSNFMSAPKFGGHIIAKYSYSDLKGSHGGDGFDARQVRAHVTGTILNDFKYRVQIELKGTPSMRDYTLEWTHWDEFHIKLGQFKRGFSYENPIGPWGAEIGEFSQITRKFCATGTSDYSGETAQTGRDIGIQVSGDILPVGTDHHRLFRYQAAIHNGNGQNTKDNNGKKDFIGSIHIQPIKDLYLGFFGWDGNYTKDNVTVDRKRWSVGANYVHKDWTVRAEYAHHKGHRLSDFDAATNTWTGKAKADAWYMMVGIPVTQWFKTFLKYDVYRGDYTNSTATSIYSFCNNFNLHRNLVFQLQYNYVNDRSNPSDKNHNEIWTEIWVRF
jgi:hypothetical protein